MQLFVSTVTPFEVSVLKGEPELPLAIINRAVDGIFVCDMILQFFLGYYDKKLNQVVCDPAHIIRR